MHSIDIAVVGAGPAGLAAALMLHASGHRVTVIERFETPKPLGSGLILQPTGLTVLHHLGLYERILARGSRIDRLFGTDARSGRAVLDVRYRTQGKGRFGIGIHRAALFGVLHDAAIAAGIPVVTGVDVAALDVGESSARLLDQAGRSVGAFDLVVDASGARSCLKSFAAHPAEPTPLAYGAFWASLDWRAGFDPNALTQRYRRASVMIGVLPIGRVSPGEREQAAFFWSLKPDDADRVVAGGLDAWKGRVAALWPETEGYLDQIRSFEDLTLAHYGHHTLRVPAGRRLAVIGDAAHSTSPQLGQGANMALLDAMALSHAIDRSGAIPDTLDAYARARRWHVRAFQAMSWAFTPFYQSDSTILPFIRDRIVATFAKIPPAPQILAAMVAGTIVDPFATVGLREHDWSLTRHKAEAADEIELT
ncbi:NAD(P)/FAD-dependent oxidoreductase [Aquamicrobium sp. LC103]|uniref:FAD-dependent oxidoreductase n=1 Tax=Aquamicrobium sp. LC103 TaxID=1120658 RepID=UPI00063E7AC6|nr:NAD(P)/FAD-dependent oxidoreductase [Aquamicrobium sp. LC103]TKT80086.1 FAD-dependent monooxygenase [Aquamicrobium sp. LC103]